MKTKLNLQLFVILLLLISPAELIFSQENEYTSPNGDSLIQAALDVIEATRYCALITTDSTGEIHVRTMDPFAPENRMVIWFGTNKFSRKVAEIKKNPEVIIYYANPQGSGYVVISGKAQIIDDAVEISKRWKEEWTQFYSDLEKSYILIKVVPKKMEVINYPLGIGNESQTWMVPSFNF
jgi:general stress protein 26